MSGRRRIPLRVVSTSLLALLAGCASIPTSGPIETLDQPQQQSQAAPFDFTPAGPRPGATPAEIVQGFMTAQLATPVNSFVAREYLTTDSATAWAPDSETLVFDDSRTVVNGSKAQISLDNPIVLDKQGRWMGPAPSDTVVLHLEQVGGQWRISSPPNALMIPRSHFDQRFQRYSLYFFDRTGKVMVPESVYLPWGLQAPTRLMSALLLGPPADLTSVERTYLPRGAQVDLSVPVDSSGVAVVPLTSASSLTGQDLEHAVAQVATTLGQLTNVSRVRLTADGQPVDYPGMADGVSVNTWNGFDANSVRSANDVYGLVGGAVLTLTDTPETASAFPAFPVDVGDRSLAVSLNGQRAAVAAGQDLYGATQGDSEAKVIYQGTDLAAPHFDLYDDLWVYDKGSPSRVQVVDPAGRTVTFTIKLPGQFRPQDTALSIDGTRWVIAGDGGILTFRIRRSADGTPLGLTPGRLIEPGADYTSVAFVSSTRLIAVRLLSGTSDIPFLQFDGSPDGASTMTAPRPGARVFTLPNDPPVIYAEADGRLFTAPSPGTWVRVVTNGKLDYPTTAG